MGDHEYSELFIRAYALMAIPLLVLCLLFPLIWWIWIPFLVAFAWSYFVARLCEWLDRD